MRVSRVAASGLAAGVTFDLTLPASGVVLLTGDNGVGKSTVVECVALATWGRPHRGEPMWGERSEVLAVVDGVELRRTRRGKKSTLYVDGAELDTPTKTQALVVLDPEVWRRSCSFSGEDRATFLRGGPMDRERALEAVLGLDGFDAVAKRARAALTQAEAAARQALLLQEEADRAADRALARFHAELRLSGAPPGETPEAELTDLGAVAEAHQHAQEEAAQATAARAVASSRLAEELARDLRGASACPTCLQPVPETQAVELLRRRRAAEEEVARAADEEHWARAAREAAWTAYQAAREAAAQARAAQAQALAEARSRAQAGARASAAEQEAAEAEERRDAQAAILASARRQEAEMRAAADIAVGLRRDLLTEALASLEELVRPEVDEFLPGAVLRFPAFEVVVEGFGRGTLGSLSTGQRRRLEVATTLALGRLAEQLAGWVGSTLFLDEVLDGLDADGKRAACSLVARAAETRCVVVITHDEDLRRDLDYVAWYHVGHAGMERRA